MYVHYIHMVLFPAKMPSHFFLMMTWQSASSLSCLNHLSVHCRRFYSYVHRGDRDRSMQILIHRSTYLRLKIRCKTFILVYVYVCVYVPMCDVLPTPTLKSMQVHTYYDVGRRITYHRSQPCHLPPWKWKRINSQLSNHIQTTTHNQNTKRSGQ